ncbi:Peptide deformylase [Plasmodium coatneyi]|uniref:Peptide deformylase n=1 Tax=Plasmodium coatneyi TaxID=208452 RepID=A0A1B1DXT8_9APIC|nr:Peptide deformylase [Plasmodium coatneyi]ANQ07564.1 Peptide deformylase [Plasmodium coatneyi]
MAKSKGKRIALTLTIAATLAVHFWETCFAYVIKQRPSLRLSRYTIRGREPSTALRMSTNQNEKDLKIVLYPDPVLRKKCNEVVNFDDNLRTLVRSMFNVMYESKGMGLAAPQVNISMKIIVWNALYEKKKKENERVFLNPSIVESSLIRSKLVEGCLSFPGIEGKVDRPSVVSISYYDLDGNKHLKILKGIHARIFQHEYDHLDGVLFIDRFSQSEKHKVRAKLNEMIRTYRSNYEGEPAI